MKGLTINPVKETITVKGFDFISDCTMSLYDFKQLCFKNNWEGTLYKVRTAEAAFEKAILNNVCQD